MAAITGLLDGARDMLGQLLAAELDFRHEAEARLRRGLAWHAMRAMELELTYQVQLSERREYVFSLAESAHQRNVADINFRATLRPLQNDLETFAPESQLRTRAIDFVELDPRQDELRLQTDLGEIRAKIDKDGDVKLSHNEARFRSTWPANWVVAVLQAAGRWAAGQGTSRERNFESARRGQGKLLHSIALQLSALVEAFSGANEIGRLNQAQRQQLGPAGARLGQQYYLDTLDVRLVAELDRDGRLAQEHSDLAWQSLELSVHLERGPQGNRLRLVRGFAGLAVGPRKAALEALLASEQPEFIASFVRDTQSSWPDDYTLRPTSCIEALLGSAQTSDRVFARIAGEGMHLALISGIVDERPGYALFELRVRDLQTENRDLTHEALVPGSLRLVAARCGDAELNGLIWRRAESDAALHDYLSLLIRCLREWLLTG